jgi:molecular chaperone DnaK
LGERPLVRDNRDAGHFALTALPPAATGVQQFAVTFLVTTDGLLTISAKDRVTGRQSIARGARASAVTARR